MHTQNSIWSCEILYDYSLLDRRLTLARTHYLVFTHLNYKNMHDDNQIDYRDEFCAFWPFFLKLDLP